MSKKKPRQHGAVTTKAEPPPPPPEPEPATTLPAAVEQFLAIYIANGFNGTAAYQEIRPDVSRSSARVLAHRLLTKVAIKARLGELVEERWKGLHMTGDEVLARVAMDARADARLLFDEHGFALRPHLWPDEITNSIESVKITKDNGLEVKLASKTSARRTILEVTGKVKGAAGGLDELADALRETLEKHTGKKQP